MNWELELSRHTPWLRKVILARTGELQAVDDVMQQVALAAVQQRAPLYDMAKVAPWLHRLAVVHSARYRRQLGRQRKAMSRLAGGNTESNGDTSALEDWLIRKERHAMTAQALANLGARDAEILLLKYGESWSYRRIAQHLGITEKAVDRRLSRARNHLRALLVSMGLDEV